MRSDAISAVATIIAATIKHICYCISHSGRGKFVMEVFQNLTTNPNLVLCYVILKTEDDYVNFFLLMFYTIVQKFSEIYK